MPLLNLNLKAIQAARAELARQRDEQRASAFALKQAQVELDAMTRRTVDARELENQQAAVEQLKSTARAALSGTAERIQSVKSMSQRLLGRQDESALVEALSTAQPVMLLPVAVQTRYNDDASLLMVRIYPDAIHTFGHEPALTEPEISEGKRYWIARFANPQDSDSPWKQLVRIYAPARSAWIVRTTTPTNRAQLGDPGPDAEALVAPQFNDETIPLVMRDAQTVYATALPDRFVVIGQARGREVFRKWGAPVADLLPMSPALDPLLVDDPENHDPFGADRAWMVNYPAALKAGMAIDITQLDLRNGHKMSQPIDRLVVLGVDWTQTPESAAELVGTLLDNHLHSAGLKFVAQGTPTNNTSSTRAGFAANGADVAAEMHPQAADARAETAASELASAGARLQRMLGLPTEVFDAGAVPGADLMEGATAGHMLNALWSATLGYTLRYFWNPLDSSKTLISNANAEELRAWAVRSLRASGPLSALRVGKQPYGILPISARGHVPTPNFPLEREVVHAVEWFRVFWDRVAPNLPPLNDPSAENLHKVLAMQPWAVAKRYSDVAGPATAENNQEFALFARFQEAMKIGVLTGLLEQYGETFRMPFISTCTVRPGDHSLDAVPWVQRDPDQPQHELDGPVPLKRNYIASLLQVLSQPIDAVRVPLIKMQNGESLLEAMLGFAADEEVLQSGHELFYGHLQDVSTVSATVKQQFNRTTIAEHIGVADSTLVGDQISVNHSRALLGLKLGGTTGALSIEEHIGAKFALPRIQWPEHMRNIASFNDSLDYLQTRTAGELQQSFRTTLDLFSTRLDAWVTSLSTHRLDAMRNVQPKGIHLGAFGVVENLIPDSSRGQNQALDSLGYVHAPSLQQATAASILRSGFLANGQAAGGAFDIDLRSRRVKRAKRLLEGLANGQSMAALLGYRFERSLRDNALSQHILECRKAFPLNPAGTEASEEPKESIAARDVVDGVRLMDTYRTTKPIFQIPGVPLVLTQPGGAIARFIEDLLDQMDSVSDLLISESVYQMVGGNMDGAGAAMMTLDKQTRPPEARVIETPHSTRGYTQRVVVALESTDVGAWAGVADDELAARMEPRLNAWLAHLLGNPARYEFAAKALTPPGEGGADWIDSGIVLTASISELGMSPLSLVRSSEAQQGAGHSAVQERLGALMSDKLRAQLAAVGNAAAADRMAVVLQADAQQAGLIGLVAFESLAWVFRRLLDKTRALRRMDMVQARDGVETNATLDDGEAAGVDIAELEVRRDLAEARGQVVLDALAAASDLAPADLETIDPDTPATAALLTQAQAALAMAYSLGWRSATADSPVAVAEGTEGQALALGDSAARAVGRARGLLSEIGGRITAAKTAAVSAGLGGQLQAALNRIRAVMGKDFPLLPLFTLGAFAGDAAATLADRDTLLAKVTLGNDDAAIAGWLPKLACVRESTALLSDALLAAEATGADSGYIENALDFQLLQFPRHSKAHWAALPPATDQDLRGVVAVAAHAPGALSSLTAVTPLSGLFVDEWMETIPAHEETTGLGFHFDAPGARPPQSILLAVPADSAATNWTLDSLLATVNEAMALTRLRTVQPKDYKSLGLLLPGIFLSNNFKQDVPSVDFVKMMVSNLALLREVSQQSGSSTMAKGTTQFTT